MNLFFGKISQNFDTKQIDGGYYIAPKGSTWFGDIKVDDYAYIIGGKKIQFWKAKEWGKIDNAECLFFEIINNDLGIKLHHFTSLNFFEFNSDLVVLSYRSSRNKAFFKLNLLSDISVEKLSKKETYENESIYRKILLHSNSNHLISNNSKDLQFYFDHHELKLFNSDFIDPLAYNKFKNNIPFIGLGSPTKDKVLKLIKDCIPNPTFSFDSTKISMTQLYDTFFCEYNEKRKYFLVGAFWDTELPQDQTNTFVSDSIWMNGYKDKFLNDVNNVPVGSYIAIQSAYVREKKNSVMMIKARGEVVENFQDGQLLKVEWENDFESFEVNFGGYMQTIKEVTNKEHIKSIWSNSNLEGNKLVNKKMKKEEPLNQILFGPPGSGKTFNTINRALEIVGINTNGRSRREIKDLYDEKVEENRIVFTTFHQSMSYEDFIEGIKPKVDEDENDNKQVIYEVENGIFKRLVENAKKTKTVSQDIIENYSFDDAWDNLISIAEKNLEAKKTLFLSIQTANLGLNVVEISGRGNLKLKPIYSDEAKKYAVSYSRAKKLQEAFPDLSVIKNIDKEFRAVIGGCNATAYWAALNFLNNKINENSKTAKQEIESPLLPHVLIIDEINRGNVSAIFGELITLIEDNKRLGNSEELEVILPYSKEKFGVPSNLYIIGTMNTADRSVEALDTALRRRFSFEEMPPNYELNEIKYSIFNYPASSILKTINDRIEKLLDKDHAIGHSYFIDKNEKTIMESFYKCIIPLLQEYFFGDYGKIGLVLGNGFVKQKEFDKNSYSFADFEYDNVADFDERKVFEIIDYRKNRKYSIGDISMTFDKAIKLLMKDKIE